MNSAEQERDTFQPAQGSRLIQFEYTTLWEHVKSLLGKGQTEVIAGSQHRDFFALNLVILLWVKQCGSQPPLTLLSQVFGNLFRGLVQPIPVSSQPDHLDRAEPFGSVLNRIAQRFKLARHHQNLNVMLGEAE